MNKGKCIFAILLLFFTPRAYGETVVGISDGLELTGSDSITIEGGSHMIYGGLKISGNSSLILKNTVITFANSENLEYTVSGNSRLTIIDSSLIWLNTGSLQAADNASIELFNVEIYSTFEMSDETFFSTGIGLAGNSKIIAWNSEIGFIRLVENAQCSVNNTILRNFGTQSIIDAEFNNCTIENILLYYEKSRVQINQTLTGIHEVLTQSQLVKAGESNNDFRMINCTLLNPPRIIVIDGKLEAKNTWLDRVYIEGDSAIETTNTRISTLMISEYCWAIIEDTKIDYMLAWRGDFNIQLINTTQKILHIFNTIGLNLHTNSSKIDQLVLDEAVENTPQNIELYKTEIGDLSITMLCPQPIQCDNVIIGNLTTAAGYSNEPPITITGNIRFTEDAKITQAIRDGYTCIRRIYLIEATIDNQPALNTELTIHLENQIKTIITNQEGIAVLPITYLHHFGLVSDPSPGGPYLYNEDNLTKPVTIELLDTNKTINILSDAPVTIQATSQTTSKEGTLNWSIYTPAAVLVTLIAIAVYFVNSRRLEEANRQIQ